MTTPITPEQVIDAARPRITLGALFDRLGLTMLDLPARAHVLTTLAGLKREGRLTLTPLTEEDR